MTTAPILGKDLLDPISDERPAGADLRWTPDWDRIKEARRSDDGLEPGKWVKRERKSANWTEVKELAEAALRGQSKDLQIALWLTEANTRLFGFAGLRESLRLVRELIVRYWDQGLYPPIEDGPEDRVGPLQWLNEKLMDVVLALPITVRSDGGQDYSLIDLQESRRIGSEAACKDADGEIDPVKKREYDAAVAEGHVSVEMFESAVRQTRRNDYETFCVVFGECFDELKLLEKAVDEKFGDAAPSFAASRSGFATLDLEIGDILTTVRKAEPELAAAASAGVVADGRAGISTQPAGLTPGLFRFSALDYRENEGSPSSWAEAMNLVNSGKVDQGLSQMTRLAASEACGRDRFQRRLMLAEVCLTIKRDRLARSILEELAAQIDKHQLDAWESSEMIAAVWARLHQIYRRQDADSERAAALFERLCKLDPWQALQCNEG